VERPKIRRKRTHIKLKTAGHPRQILGALMTKKFKKSINGNMKFDIK
jgi:hypothetical protein